MGTSRTILAIFLVAIVPTGSFAAKVHLVVTQPTSPDPLSCRVYLVDREGKAVLPTAFLSWRDHFVFAGDGQFDLPAGDYGITIERGPEFTRTTGALRIGQEQLVKAKFEIHRIVNLADEGWWSGEIHVHRSPSDIELLMRAEDLHIAPVITWWNSNDIWRNHAFPTKLTVGFDSNRFYNLMAGEDERAGGALLYFGLQRPLPIANAGAEYPPSLQFLALARRQPGTWVDIEKPFWYDVPVWLASGMVDSIEIANNHMMHSQVMDGEAWGRERDRRRFPPSNGNGLWTQEIYYQILNCGLRIPPSAGSASGVLTNPLGYNRAYVHLDGALSYDAWWNGLRAGCVFVTNGPLLRVSADSQWPGHVFKGRSGETMTLDLDASLDSRDPIARIDVVKNGAIERTISRSEWIRAHSLGQISFSESGWFLVRVISDVPETFRFASTAPFYVEMGEGRRRQSRSSAQFFLGWVRERSSRIHLADPTQQAEALRCQADAERFWERKVQDSNAD